MVLETQSGTSSGVILFMVLETQSGKWRDTSSWIHEKKYKLRVRR